jgi:hypothetical protein
VRFVDRETEKPYLSARNGRFQIRDEGVLRRQLQDDDRARIFTLLAPDICRDLSS